MFCFFLNPNHDRARSSSFSFSIGDLSHLASIFILLHKIQTSRSCRGISPIPFATYFPHLRVLTSISLLGISFKTQVLYVTVFVARYLDIFSTWVSFYNFAMKLFFICSSVYILYLMKVRFRYVTILFLCLRMAQPHCVHTHVSGQQTTRPSTPSVSSTSSAPPSSSVSSSTTPTPSQKYPGPSPSSSKPLPSSRNSSSSSAQAKQKQSRHTTSPRWAHTVDCTSLTGYTGASSSTRVVLCACTLGIYDR